MSQLTDWTQVFPNLGIFGYKRTSCETDLYNCFAWAAGENTQRWEPDDFGLFYWPMGVARRLTRATIVAAYKTVGFDLCANSDLEIGVEKLAIYFIGARPTHAARQLSNGKWTSKLGQGDDIVHTLDGLNDADPKTPRYGKHQVYMSRKLLLPT